MSRRRLRMAAVAAAVAVAFSAIAYAEGLTAEDFAYLQKTYGVTSQSGAIAELTPNEQRALHSAIDDIKSYPEARDREVQRYLWLVYGRECKHWAEAHADHECSPVANSELEPGKEISDRICAECHLFGTDTAPSYHRMANERDWDQHKVEHALHHTPAMVPVTLTPEMLRRLAAYINSFK